MLGGLAPLLTVATPKQRAGVLLEKQSPTTKITVGGNELTVVTRLHVPVGGAGAQRSDMAARRRAGAGVGPDEYVVAGNGIIVTFPPSAGIERVDEGRYDNGKWIADSPPQRRRDPPGPPGAAADGRLRATAREAVSAAS